MTALFSGIFSVISVIDSVEGFECQVEVSGNSTIDVDWKAKDRRSERTVKHHDSSVR